MSKRYSYFVSATTRTDVGTDTSYDAITHMSLPVHYDGGLKELRNFVAVQLGVATDKVRLRTVSYLGIEGEAP